MYSRIRLFFHHFPELQGFFIFKDIPVLPSASFSFFFYLPYSYLKKIGPPRKYQCFKKIVAPNAPPPTATRSVFLKVRLEMSFQSHLHLLMCPACLGNLQSFHDIGTRGVHAFDHHSDKVQCVTSHRKYRSLRESLFGCDATGVWGEVCWVDAFTMFFFNQETVESSWGWWVFS